MINNATVGSLKKAIRGNKIVSFYYHNLQRTVEPHHVGLLNHSQQLHAYQIKGQSESGGIPEWRNFQLSHIENIKLEDESFIRRSSYNPRNSHYTTIELSLDDI